MDYNQIPEPLIEPLTQREQDVLQLIAQGLTNREIANKLFLAMSTIKWYIKQIYGKLQVSTRIEAIAWANHHDSTTPQSNPKYSSIHNIPRPPLPLIGRDRELTELTTLLNDAETRLITILGSGGIGKTRLALEVASNMVDSFEYGVFFISLAPLSAPNLIVSAIAEAINLSLQGALAPMAQLLAFTQGKQILVVLDNFEHLLDGIDIISDILQNAPSITMLITSRERLNVYGETVYNIQGIPYPTGSDLVDVLNYSAIQLFIQSARRAKADFDPSDDDLSFVVSICQRLQGMPLAIELTAAWVRILSLKEIASEISQGLDLLTTSRRDMIERHKTIRAVFDHSWRILELDEQQVFSALAVLRGGFTRDAAEKVAGATLQSLTAAIDKSLLRHDGSGYYDMHELIREYLVEKLSESTEREMAVRNRHCIYYADFMAERTLQLKGGNQLLAQDEINAEFANIRESWHYGLDHNQYDQLYKYIEGFRLFYLQRGQFHDAVDLLEYAITSLEADLSVLDSSHFARVRIHALASNCLAMISIFLSDFQRSRELLVEAIRSLKQIGANIDLVPVLLIMAILDDISGDYLSAEQHLQSSLALSEEIDDEHGIAWAYDWLGVVAYRQGDYNKAKQLLEYSIKIREKIGDKWGLATTLMWLGKISHLIGDYERSRHLLKQSVALQRQLNSVWGRARALTDLGDVVCKQGDYGQAQQYVSQSLALLGDVGDRYQQARAYTVAGNIATGLNDLHTAKRHFHHALQLVSEAGHSIDVFNIMIGTAQMMTIDNQIERAYTLATVLLLHSDTPFEVRSDAEDLIEELHTSFDSEVLEILREKAESQSLEQIVSQLLVDIEV